MGNIARGRGRETNRARGEADTFTLLVLETTPE